MNKKFYKLIKRGILLLCFVSIAFVTSACAKPDTQGSNSTAKGQTSSTKEKKAEDLNGYEWTIISLWGDKENSHWNPQQGVSAVDDAWYSRIQQIQTEYNCKIKMKTLALDNFYQNVISATMAGDKLADYLLVDYSRFQRFCVAGVLAPVNEMPNIDLKDEKWSKTTTEAGTFEGKVYGCNFGDTNVGSVCFFNSTLLKEKNAVDPYQLYKDGKWTWAEFEKLAKSMTIDENGDNTPETYGVGTVDWAGFHFEVPFIYANGGNVMKLENGKYRFSLLDNDAQESLTFVKNLYDEKVVYPLNAQSEADAVKLFSQRKVAFMFEQWGFANWIKNMKDDYGLLPVPKGPKATDYISMNSQIPLYVATVATKDKYKSSLIFNLMTDTLPKTGDVSVDDPYYNLRNIQLRDDFALTIYKDLTKKVVPCLMNTDENLISTLYPQIYACTKDNKSTPKAAMESVASKCQLFINDFFKSK